VIRRQVLLLLLLLLLLGSLPEFLPGGQVLSRNGCCHQNERKRQEIRARVDNLFLFFCNSSRQFNLNPDQDTIYYKFYKKKILSKNNKRQILSKSQGKQLFMKSYKWHI
jgi:hypothetical protein